MSTCLSLKRGAQRDQPRAEVEVRKAAIPRGARIYKVRPHCAAGAHIQADRRARDHTLHLGQPDDAVKCRRGETYASILLELILGPGTRDMEATLKMPIVTDAAVLAAGTP
jgi:hypothetical protein